MAFRSSVSQVKQQETVCCHGAHTPEHVLQRRHPQVPDHDPRHPRALVSTATRATSPRGRVHGLASHQHAAQSCQSLHPGGKHSTSWKIHTFPLNTPPDVRLRPPQVLLPVQFGTQVDEVRLKRALSELEDTLDKLESMFLRRQPFLCGDDITVADLLAVCELTQVRCLG